MTLPLNKKQKQLVEKSMDLVPIMIRSMTRTAAYVTEEEQQELCQIGYLALCRSAVGFEEGRSFQPYAKTIIRHAIFATMSSDEFKKDKHYPKKTFFYGICLFCFR